MWDTNETESKFPYTRLIITKTRLFKYIENLTTKKRKIFRYKILIVFKFLFKTDCGYSLEPLRRDGSNEYPQPVIFSKIRKLMYTPVNPSFTISKWGLRESKLYRHVFVMISLSPSATVFGLYSFGAKF